MPPHGAMLSIVAPHSGRLNNETFYNSNQVNCEVNEFIYLYTSLVFVGKMTFILMKLHYDTKCCVIMLSVKFLNVMPIDIMPTLGMLNIVAPPSGRLSSKTFYCSKQVYPLLP